MVNGQPGKELRDNLLTEQLNELVRKRQGKRRVRAVVRTTKPEISTSEVAEEYPTYLTVSQSEYTVRLWKNLEMVAEYPIAVGQPAYPTPYGLFSIDSKQVDPVWSVPNSDWAGELAGTVVAGGTAANPLKARWMGVTDGVGFHGTDSTTTRSAPPPRTAACGCTSTTSSRSTTRSRSARPSTSVRPEKAQRPPRRSLRS